MRIEYRVGDLLDSGVRVILHGCNAQGVMGSGVAKAVRDRYPAAYDIYKAEYDTRGLPLGSVVWAKCDDRLIANGITQEFYGRDPTIQYVDYDAVRRAIREVDGLAQQTQGNMQFADSMGGMFEAVGMPLIGAGFGNGRWSIIAAIIEEESRSFHPIVYTLDGRIPE